ncbi:hypothetical protein TRFO_33092 [Tritrichomonas foetus]|uniref:Proteasome activator complex subunit 4-like HEAT repeat-like domain-containing protein n=1 Tax=Tritrichomonas foetus TaxID=1144522 RepID=A0A1J4JMD2_9EUKA|nr:hypothetical protein TRFO_33092 [Tritrichomonas foetus]|eukprot:OHT00263.1 hypothetical protein TRFO_33092 [Tritrichomonas foetus]
MSACNQARADALKSLLPQYIQDSIEDEQKEWKAAILQKLPDVLSRGKSDEVEFWITALEDYIELKTFTFTYQEVEIIAQTLFDFIITTKDMNLLKTVGSAFVLIVKPQHIKINLVLEWKPLYKLIYDVMISHSKTKTRKYPSKLAFTLISIVRISRNYFSETATDEMLDMWSHMLDPSQHTFILAQCLLSLFLPVNLGQHNKWLQKFLDLWTLFRNDCFDFQFFSLFARLSRFGFDDIPWDRILPFLFNIISYYTGIPTTLLPPSNSQILNYHPELFFEFFKDINSASSSNFRLFSMIVVNLLTGKTKELARSLVERLLHLIAPFCTASSHSEDEEQCFAPVELLNEFVSLYLHRYQKEKKYGSLHEPLTQDDNDWFVSKILPLILMEIFHEDPQFSYIMEVVQLAPSMTILPIFQAVENSLEYVHLKQGAYATLTAVAPTVIYTKEGLTDFMMILEKHLPEDLNFMDTLKTSVVFSLMTVISASMKFSEEHEPFILEVTQKCILFAQHAIGEEYATSLAELMTMLGCVVRSSPQKTVNKIVQMVKNDYENIPENGLLAIVEALEVYCVKSFSSIALNPKKIKDYIVLEAMVRQNEKFTLENIEKIQLIIESGAKNEDRKIQKVSLHILKWLLRNLMSVYPDIPKNAGITLLTKANLVWHVPSEEEKIASIATIEFGIKLMHEFFEKDDRKSQKIAVGIGKSLLKGIQSAVSDTDMVHEEEGEYFKQPKLKIFSVPEFVKYFEQIYYELFEFIEKPNIHVTAIKRVIQTVIQTIIPKDSMASNLDSVISEYRIYSNMAKLSNLLPPLESMTYLIAYSKSMIAYASRSSVKQNYITKLMRNITEKIFSYAKYHHTRVRTLINIYFANITAQFRTQFVDYIERCIDPISDPSLDEDTLSGYCSVAFSIANFDVSVRSFDIMSKVALAVCRQLPKDVPDDSARHLRQVVVVYLDQIDPCDPRMNNEEIFKIREFLAIEAMDRHAKNKVSRETQNYAAALVCSVIVGHTHLMSLPFFNFLISIITTDDMVVRDCIVQMIPTIIEKLIPRVPRPIGLEVEEVTPENYDLVAFKDRPFHDQAKMKPRFLTREELMDSNVLSEFLSSDVINDRIEVHKLIFEKICDDHTIVDKFIAIIIDSQVHKEETFLKTRVLFWSTLCRFIGIEFILELIQKLYKMIDPNSTLAHHVIAAEIFAGSIHSLKGRKYEEVEKVSNVVKPFVTQLIQTIDPEYHSIWYFSFYASFTDIDPRRIFWLYDHILTCVPKGDGLRAARSVSLICDILLDAAYNIKSLRSKIQDIAAQPLFSKESLQFEQVRECSVRALSSILAISFDLEKRGFNEESHKILDRFLSETTESFIIRWIYGQFSSQSTSSIASGGYILEHLNHWVDYIVDKDEKEEKIARSALMSAATSNWLGSICKLPISLENVMEMIDKMLDALNPKKHHWQVQTAQLLITESFLGSIFFFLDDSVLEGMIEDRIIPGLLHQHPDVQDAASQLLTFVVKNSLLLRDKLPYIVARFINMLQDRENLSRRIAGAKGLGSIISGTLLFDYVPQYVIDSFSALTEALEVDTSVETIITQFLSDFWAIYDNNLMKNIAETLAPFHASLRPSYFC